MFSLVVCLPLGVNCVTDKRGDWAHVSFADVKVSTSEEIKDGLLSLSTFLVVEDIIV